MSSMKTEKTNKHEDTDIGLLMRGGGGGGGGSLHNEIDYLHPLGFSVVLSVLFVCASTEAER